MISERNAIAWISTGAERLIAKWSVASERFPRLEHVARITHWLDAQGLPVSAPLQTTDGRLQVEVDGVLLSLQHAIAGDLLTWAIRIRSGRLARPWHVFIGLSRPPRTPG